MGALLLVLFFGFWIGFAIWARIKKRWSGIVSVGGGLFVGFTATAIVGVGGLLFEDKKSGSVASTDNTSAQPTTTDPTPAPAVSENGFPTPEVFKQRWNASHESPYIITSWRTNDPTLHTAQMNSPINIAYDPRDGSYQIGTAPGPSPDLTEFAIQYASFIPVILPDANASERRIASDLASQSLHQESPAMEIRGVRFNCTVYMGLSCYAKKTQ